MPKGKYAAVLKNVPRLVSTEPDYQTKVDLVKQGLLQRLDPPRASTFAKEYAALRHEKDTINDKLSDINLRLEAVTQLLIDHMEAEGLSSLKLDTGRSISTWSEPYPQVVDKDIFRQWCIDNGLGRLLQLWPSTTESLVKNMLMEGKTEPPGIKVWSKYIIRLGSER